MKQLLTYVGLVVVLTLACKSEPRAPVAASSPPPPAAASPAPPAPEPPAPEPAHPSLSEAQLQRVKALQATLAEVDPTPLEEWIEDVTRHNDPERELKMYEGMATAYRSFCEGKQLSQEAKMEVYQVVLLRSGAKDAVVLPQLTLKAITRADAKAILRRYPLPPMTPSESSGR